MFSHKDRLYISLYARGGSRKMPGQEDTYHWAFTTGPKTESSSNNQGKSRRIHAKEKITLEGSPPTARSVWEYENLPLSECIPGPIQLVRVVIGKIKNPSRLKDIFDSTPLRPEVEGWTCVGWVKEAFETALEDGEALGRSAASWKDVRDTAVWYVDKKKKDHRFDGKGVYDMDKVATWDMLEKRELVP